MSFEGTYEELQDFLLRLRNLARLVTVNEVNYEPVEKGGETTMNSRVENLLNVGISAETYVQPAAGEATTSTGETPAPSGRTTTRSEETTTSSGGGTTSTGKAGKSKGGKS